MPDPPEPEDETGRVGKEFVFVGRIHREGRMPGTETLRGTDGFTPRKDPPQENWRARATRLAWLPVPLLLLAFLTLWAEGRWAGGVWLSYLRVPHEAPVLLMFLNFAFTAMVSLFVAYLIARSFEARGTPGLLLLGCGVLIWSASGLVASVAGWLGAGTADFTNTLVTIHNVLAWLSGLCHLSGVVLSLRPTRSIRAPALAITASYAATIGTVGMVALATVTGRMPLFFVQGEGGTPLRQIVLGSAIAMFAFTSLLMGATHRRSWSAFTYWYALALALVATGLLGVMIEDASGSMASWIGRATQYLGAVYMLVAAVSSAGESGVWGIPLEQALREERNFAAAVLDTVGALVVVLDREGRIVRFSHACERATGYAAGEVLGKPIWDLLLAPGEKERVKETFNRLKGGKFPLEHENDWLAKDGSRRRIVWSNTCLADEGGKVRFVIGTGMDVTERKRTQEELLRARELLEAVTRGTDVIIAAQDTGHRYTYFNEAYAREIRQLTGKDLRIGTSMMDLFADMPEQQKVAVEEWSRALRGENVSQRIEFGDPGRRRRLYSAHKTPLRDAAGNVVGAGEVAYDVTREALAEERLRQSEERYRNLFDGMTEGFALHEIILDRQGRPIDFRFLEVNRAFETLTGLKREDVVGNTHSALLPGDNPIWVQAYGEVALTGKSVHFEEYSLALKRHYEVVAYRPAPLQFAVVFKDVSKRKKAEEALREMNLTLERRVAERTMEASLLADRLRALAADLTQTEQRERKRLAMVLHDHVQQLMVAASMQLGMVQREPLEKDTVALLQGIGSILKEAINATRSLAVELSPPILHTSGLAGGLTWLAGRMADKHQFAVRLSIDKDAEPGAEEIRLLLFESVRELLFNVLKHAGVGAARLTMSRTEGQEVKIVVEDDGRGFDPRLVAAQTSGGGTFGLFSIQQRLAYFQGKMEIEAAPGAGTRVILTAPLGGPTEGARMGHSPAADEKPPARVPPRGDKIRLVLADDHRILREGLAGMLKTEPDIEVVGESADVSGTISLTERLRPDVVIMDVTLPDGTGIEAAEILTRRMPGVKVIGLSMHADRNIAAAMLAAGAVAYLTKGGPSQDLLAAIRAACPAGEGRGKT